MRQAIGLYRTIDHRFGEVIALTNLGDVCYRQGGYQRAAEHQEQALALVAGTRQPPCRGVGAGQARRGQQPPRRV